MLGDSEDTCHVAVMDTVKWVSARLWGCREGGGYTVSDVASVERPVIGSKSVDHLIFILYRYSGTRADGKTTGDKSKIFDSHGDRGDRLGLRW